MSKEKFLATCAVIALITFTISMVCAAVYAGVLVWTRTPTATAIYEATIVRPVTLTPTVPPPDTEKAPQSTMLPVPTAAPTLAQSSPTASPLSIVALLPLWTPTQGVYPPPPTFPPPGPTTPTETPPPPLPSPLPTATTCALDWGLQPLSWENYDTLFQCYRFLYGDPPRPESPPFCPPSGSPWVEFAEFNYGLCLSISNGTPYAPPPPAPTEVIP